MKWYVTLSLALALFGCDIIKGPAGPQGPPGAQGPAGEDLEITLIKGTLVSGELIDGGEGFFSYWEMELPVTERHIIIVHVRRGPDFTWVEPVWDLGEWDGRWYVIIYEAEPVYENEPVGPGYEYRIAIAE